MLRHVGKDSGLLFSTYDLRSLIEQRCDSMRSEVEGLEPNRLLDTSSADLAAYLADKYRLDAPRLRPKDEWSADERETKIDVRHDQRRHVSDRSRPCLIPGQRIEVEIPVDGEHELLHARASTFNFSPPRAQVRNGKLLIVLEVAHDAAERDLRGEIDRTVREVEEHLAWVRNDLEGLNRALPSDAERAVADRRRRVLENQGRASALGIPLKMREGIPATYAIPDVRRKAVPKLPEATSLPYEPEPVLDAEHYEHVLEVVQNMVHVMERSPSSFSHMGEEALRDHFLVQLNGHFEGRATGETFNAGGKTDILLRENGRNVFIAECKFWNGPKRYRETIDQLLGYSSWRDAKTAILVFNRGTSTTKVLEGVAEQTGNHPNCKRQVAWKHESGFRYVFHHPGDRNRELTVTVLVFDVPSPAEKG